MTHQKVLVKGLSVEFQEPVLQGLFLELKKGEFVSVVGKSGVGKTTLLNALAGLISFKGTIKKPSKTALVFQNYSLFPWMNVKENISFGSDSNNLDKIYQMINIIGLKGKESSFPNQLSGGQQQRVAIGRALFNNPDLLLLDEPFASLDSYTRLQMQEWIKELMEKNNITTILVTHDVDEAVLLGDRILVMKNKTIENEIAVPFIRPRANEIRYTTAFQEIKKKILELLKG